MKQDKNEVMDVAKAKATGAQRKENDDLNFKRNEYLYEARVMGYQIDMDNSFTSLRNRMAQRHVSHQPVQYWQINTTTNHKQQVVA